MTQAELTAALPGLRRALSLGDEADARLADALEAAEEAILRYLNREKLPECAHSLLVELAALKYLRGTGADAGQKSVSYAEGQLSQSESYYSPAEFQAGEAALLGTLAPYRQVRCREENR